MDKNTILDYATNSPENTNRNVLGSMLDQFSKNSGNNVTKLYLGPPPETDPDLPEGIDWAQNDTINAGLYKVPNGTPLTVLEIKTLIESNSSIIIIADVDDFGFDYLYPFGAHFSVGLTDFMACLDFGLYASQDIRPGRAGAGFVTKMV